MMESLDQMYELFYVAAYGCNRRCEHEIKRVFDAHEKDAPLFLFYEFFLSHPLAKHVEREQDLETQVYLLTPFAPRLAEHGVVVPGFADGAVRMAFRTGKALREMMLIVRWDSSLNTKNAFEHWCRDWNDPTTSDELGHISSWERVADRATGDDYHVGLINKWTLSWQETSHPREISDQVSERSARAIAKLYKPNFVEMSDENVKGIFVPIASSRLFYGGIWVMFPGLDGDGHKQDSFRNAVGLSVAKLVDRTYLRSLALLHEHLLENLQADSLTDNDSPVLREEFKIAVEGSPVEVHYRNAFMGLPPLGEHRRRGAEITDEIENLLGELWRQRKADGCWGKSNGDFKKSLIFKNYLVCSESMTRLLHKVITAAKTMRKAKGALPACLVVGGAGSGKETLAKMLRLFSTEYRTGQEYVVNLAAIRPAPITAAMIAGVELKGSFSLEVQGILRRILEEAKGKRPTLCFDEFNSMDPDSQGVLLRFLDNSEIFAVGAVEGTKDVDCFVIGLMNEDPEDISRERAMEFFRSGEYLGSFLGDLLYEHFLRIRRLRPDIKYRMIRNGKFIIPPLRERREDIPLLFHVFINSELETAMGGRGDADKARKKLHVSLEVLDRVMARDLLWQGNIRQLQALAKLVAQRLADQAGDHPTHFVVTLRVLNEALEEVGLVNRPSDIGQGNTQC